MTNPMQKTLYLLLVSSALSFTIGCSGASETTSTPTDAIQEYADANPAPPEVPLDGE
ncbi:hypothetical protein [Rhodopirellula bahusiensis]|uniref:hypothetical protein n=2 Tax=Rhodopirellula bahusiensis TaxID=2014065 RepID=UPI0032642001